jgi:capsular polysaccharide biosynthesis protein
MSRYVDEVNVGGNLSTLLTLASSQPVLQNVIRKLDLKLNIQEMEGKINISQEGGTGILRISVTANESREAKVIAQTLGEEFLAYIDELNKQETKTARTFLEERLDQARKELLDAKRRLHEFQTGKMSLAVASTPGSAMPSVGVPPGIIDVDSMGTNTDLTKRVTKKIADTDQDLSNLRQRLENVKAQLTQMGGKLAKTPKTVPVTVKSVVRAEIQELRRQRDSQRVEITRLLVTKTKDHPDVVMAQRYLDQLEKRLKVEEAKPGMVIEETVDGPNPSYQMLTEGIAKLQAEQEGIVAMMGMTEQALKKYQDFLPRAPLEEIRLNNLILEAHAREQTYMNLSREVDAIRVAEKVQNKLGNLTLMGPPLVYGGPLQSVVKNLALALMMAIGAGLGVVIALDYLDNRVKTPQDVETLLQLPILGIIPASETYPASWRRNQGWTNKVLNMRERVARMLPGGRDDR